MSENKTAQIFRRCHFEQTNSYDQGNIELNQPKLHKAIMEAMQEYSDQQTAQLKKEVEELKENAMENIEILVQSHESYSKLQQHADRMEEALSCVVNLEQLICYNGPVKTEHETEAQAIDSMYDKVISSMNIYRNFKEGKSNNTNKQQL